MDKSDYVEFASVWSAALDAYGRTPSDSAIDLCFSALIRFEIYDIRRGLSGHMNDPENGRFFPKPADIVRQIEGDSESRALLAWSKVEDTIRGAGAYKSIVFDEPEIMAAIDSMGGWLRLCEMTEGDAPFRRNEFCKLYKGYLVSAPKSYPSKLLGLTEAHNMTEHVDRIPPPVMVGDYNKAVKVLESAGSSRGKMRELSVEIAGMIGKDDR